MSSAKSSNGVSETLVLPNKPNNNSKKETETLPIIDVLTQHYGIDRETASKAVEAVGANSSVLQCYRHILDSASVVAPASDAMQLNSHYCPHLQHHKLISPQDVSLQDCSCSHFRDTATTLRQTVQDEQGERICPSWDNLLCLDCGKIRCSRFGNAHAIAHWQETREAMVEKQGVKPLVVESKGDGHCLAVSLKDFKVWCHLCRAPVAIQSSTALSSLIEHVKEEMQKISGDDDDHDDHEPDRKKRRAETDQDKQSSSSSSSSSSSHREYDDDKPSGNESDDEGSDGPTIDLDDMDDDTLLQFLTTVANAQGIPVELLIESVQRQSGEPDDPNIEYPFGDTPNSLAQVAEFIQSDKCKKILILAGAGISVSSGIPDYRSADGFYANMRADELTATPVQREAIRADPTVALEQEMFLQNPLPCLELKRDFILGTYTHRWKATLAHRFVEMLQRKTQKVARMYTQNIDGLEDQCTGIPRDKIIAVHGSMDRAECASCETESDYDQFCQAVRTQIKDLTKQDPTAPTESSPIVCPSCGKGTMKPAIVLFRSSLPRIFFEKMPGDVSDVDLLIVMGTSLRVAPANSLIWRVPKTCMRVLMNNEEAGSHLGLNFGEGRVRDFHASGHCDDVALDLMDHLGWLPDLAPLASNGELPAQCAQKLREKLARLSVAKADDSTTRK